MAKVNKAFYTQPQAQELFEDYKVLEERVGDYAAQILYLVRTNNAQVDALDKQARTIKELSDENAGLSGDRSTLRRRVSDLEANTTLQCNRNQAATIREQDEEIEALKRKLKARKQQLYMVLYGHEQEIFNLAREIERTFTEKE